MALYGFVGFKNSGKDTAAKILCGTGDWQQISFAAPLKDLTATLFNWPRNLLEGDTDESRKWREEIDIWWAEKLKMPNFTPRLALQILGTDALRKNLHKDLWVIKAEKSIQSATKNVVITDCRFPNEIAMIRENGGKIFWIAREIPSWIGEIHILLPEIQKLGEDDPSVQSRLKYLTQIGAHESEWRWMGECLQPWSKFQYDVKIDNRGSIDELAEQILEYR